MTVPLSIEEETALIRLMWGIGDGEDEGYVQSAIEKKQFQICAFCQVHPKLSCEKKECYLAALLRDPLIPLVKRYGL